METTGFPWLFSTLWRAAGAEGEGVAALGAARVRHLRAPDASWDRSGWLRNPLRHHLRNPGMIPR